MKIKTQDLIGAQLDWAVAKCEGWTWHTGVSDWFGNEPWLEFVVPGLDHWGGPSIRRRQLWQLAYSTDWAQGGPIIEREKMYLNFGVLGDQWETAVPSRTFFTSVSYGETALVAAMRAFVHSWLGPEVETPEELLK